ncbi:hypothetical protein SISSUDRAFT_494344 [Sistotremastrum suecicum HHB10207 ss-3]|uniref:Uncharacterized protein n=1 Tax=Sistotremastrum suecicum HHB10207 ss-3 TaxID=1314776 RepID=A0A166IHD5_9AGAM|nr:hypothetical protein SISSUDRAFT_494344 [Sistotremastrum suecicum HHB10207 ss-3]
MADYDFNPGGRLKLKGGVTDGGVKNLRRASPSLTRKGPNKRTVNIRRNFSLRQRVNLKLPGPLLPENPILPSRQTERQLQSGASRKSRSKDLQNVSQKWLSRLIRIVFTSSTLSWSRSANTTTSPRSVLDKTRVALHSPLGHSNSCPAICCTLCCIPNKLSFLVDNHSSLMSCLRFL